MSSTDALAAKPLLLDFLLSWYGFYFFVTTIAVLTILYYMVYRKNRIHSWFLNGEENEYADERFLGI